MNNLFCCVLLNCPQLFIQVYVWLVLTVAHTKSFVTHRLELRRANICSFACRRYIDHAIQQFVQQRRATTAADEKGPMTV